MKLLLCFILFSMLNLSGSVFSQNAINLEVNGKTVKEVFKDIESQSNLRFLYNDDFTGLNRVVSINTQDRSIDDVMGELLAGAKLTYRELENELIVITPTEAYSQQQNQVSGTVTDEDENPLPGVTIVIDGTTIGTTTDIDGDYTLQNVDPGAILVYSFVGYSTQRISVEGRTEIDVTLTTDAIDLEEVIIVGYGTQAKVNLTGSVSNVSGDELQGKAVSRTSLALAGEMSGISFRQLSGNPGRDAPRVIVRGLGTFSTAGTSPLVIVDGIPSSLDAVNPNDIESISVLKDAASASIFGSRAANGVILVETKKGREGVMRISYNNYISRQVPTSFPQFLDSWEYAEAFNEALANMDAAPLYSDEDIRKFKSGEDPDNYPNKHHLKDFFTSGSGLQTRHDLVLTSGTSETQYYFSAGYIRNEGIVKYNNNDRYQLRLNADSKIRDNVHLSVNLSGDINEWEEPIGRYNNLDGIVTGAMRLPNVIPGRKTDGTYGHIETHHPEACLESGSFYQSQGKGIRSNVNLSWNIFKDLKITGIMGYRYSNGYAKTFNTEYDVTPIFNVSPNKLSVSNSNSTGLVLQSLINYDIIFGDHTVNLLGGFSSEDNYSNSIGAYRDIFPTNLLPEINVGSAVNRTNSGSASRNRLLSYFGRGNYSYQGKYLLEGNLRYDGSSRFPEGRRFGLFPSFSAGWRISEEDFFQNVPLIDELKIRGSWGELGNQSIGNYPYQALIALGQDYPIGGSLAAGASVNTLPNRNINWETTRITDVGLDVYLFQNRLGLTADYFVKTTFDILYHVAASPMLGASPTVENAATVENRGFDLDLTYRQSFQDFSFSVTTNLTAVNNKVLEIANLEEDIARGLFVGHPIGAYYGYVSDGLFIDENDIQNYPSQPYNALPGTIRLKDISGPDGVPDGQVTMDDRKVLGSDWPKYLYGLRMNARYKNWDAYVVFQGEGGMLRTLNTYAWAFVNAGNIQRWIYEQRWTQENPDPNAGYPRLQTTGTAHLPALDLASDFWYYDGTYLRLKNLQIGYNLPSSILQRLSISNARIYISGTNLLTFDNNQEGWDPEMQLRGSARFYPPTSVYSFGVSIDF